jgi:alpha-1,3-glucosyltransferase
MAKVCLACTAVAIIPSSVNLIWNSRKKKFLYALVNSSLAFFLFSFQVHEKSILIPAIVAILIFPAEPFVVFWFLQVSTFSMFPLLVKDGQVVSFIGLSCCYIGISKIIIDNMKNGKLQNTNFLRILWKINKSTDGKVIENIAMFSFVLSTLAQIILIIGFLFVPPPVKLPFLHPLLISAFSCFHFLGFFIYFNVKQIFYE